MVLNTEPAAGAWLRMVMIGAASAAAGGQDLPDAFAWLVLAAEAAGIASYWVRGPAAGGGARPTRAEHSAARLQAVCETGTKYGLLHGHLAIVCEFTDFKAFSGTPAARLAC